MAAPTPKHIFLNQWAILGIFPGKTQYDLLLFYMIAEFLEKSTYIKTLPNYFAKHS